MTPQTIVNILRQHMPEAIIRVDGDDGVHFAASIISEQFDGMSMVARHRLVYQALGDHMQSAIHALSIQAMTPAESTAQGEKT